MSEPDWADKRAGDWLDPKARMDRQFGTSDQTSLAALLREDRRNVLAEVRRMVEAYAWPQACRDEILRRLEKL